MPVCCSYWLVDSTHYISFQRQCRIYFPFCYWSSWIRRRLTMGREKGQIQKQLWKNQIRIILNKIDHSIFYTLKEINYTSKGNQLIRDLQIKRHPENLLLSSFSMLSFHLRGGRTILKLSYISVYVQVSCPWTVVSSFHLLFEGMNHPQHTAILYITFLSSSS